MSKPSQFRYGLLKAIDLSGLTFLSPVVRLLSGEEPRKQWREIGQYIVIPLCAIGLFVVLWSVIAPHHRTKSGEVPTPAVVWGAAGSIWQFHVREGDKAEAYALEGESREQQLQFVQQRLAGLAEQKTQADALVAQAESRRSEAIATALAPLEEKYRALEAEQVADRTAREAKLKGLAVTIIGQDIAAKEAYLTQMRAHQQATEREREALARLREQQDDVRKQPDSALVKAMARQTQLAEDRQYLEKVADQLQSANRGLKIEAATKALNQEKIQFVQATSAEQAYALADKIVMAEDRTAKMASADYPKPWTLPMQILRSVACVFIGFLIGSVIAIPLGVMCGLNKICMAAMTPFIALFKPVSPIVWLPIALIIVGGFVPDPDKHWLITSLKHLPLIGWMEINPAFIASAITVALCSLWATLVNTALGVSSIDKDHLNVARVLRLGFWSRLTKIVIPSALPLIFAGLRISLGVGWMVLIAAELLSSSEGIGKFVWDQFCNGASDSFAKMMVVVFVVGFIGLLLDRIMIVLQKLVTFDGGTVAA